MNETTQQRSYTYRDVQHYYFYKLDLHVASAIIDSALNSLFNLSTCVICSFVTVRPYNAQYNY